MIIIIIITLIRKFLKRVDNLTSSAGIVASFLDPYRRQANRSTPYAELGFTGVVKMLYIRRISWMHKWKITKYKNNGVQFFIFITPLYWRARFKNDTEVVK